MAFLKIYIIINLPDFVIQLSDRVKNYFAVTFDALHNVILLYVIAYMTVKFQVYNIHIDRFLQRHIKITLTALLVRKFSMG